MPPAAAALFRPADPAQTLNSPISRWDGWAVRFRCGDPCCPPIRPLAVAELLAARGDVTVRAMAASLRCSVCGQAAAAVSLRRSCAGGEIIQPVQGGVLL